LLTKHVQKISEKMAELQVKVFFFFLRQKFLCIPNGLALKFEEEKKN